jgi:hypothetical protein
MAVGHERRALGPAGDVPQLDQRPIVMVSKDDVGFWHDLAPLLNVCGTGERIGDSACLLPVGLASWQDANNDHLIVMPSEENSPAP